MTYPAAQRPRTLRFRALRSIGALILREMATRYGALLGGMCGWFWSLWPESPC